MSYQSNPAEDRITMIEWAQEMVSSPDVVYLDTETTGIGPGTEIVDIAVVDNAGSVLMDTLVRPDIPIPAGASRVHGIYDEDVANARSWPVVYPHVAQFLAMQTVVIYNADYDVDVISQCCQRGNLQIPMANWDCAMKAYSAFVGELSTHKRGGYRWFKLDQAARAFGIEPGTHRALADADACRQVVHAMARATF